MSFWRSYLIGFDLPYAADPVFQRAPLLTDVTARLHGILPTGRRVGRGCRVWRATNSREGLTVISLPESGLPMVCNVSDSCLTFVFGSTQAMTSTDRECSPDALQRMSDMFVNSSLLLLVLAAGVVAFRDYALLQKGHG